MSAIDDVIQYHADNCQSGSECDLSALSRAELAAKDQRIAELGRMLDNCMTDAAELTVERDAAREQLAVYQRREAIRQ